MQTFQKTVTNNLRIKKGFFAASAYFIVEEI